MNAKLAEMLLEPASAPARVRKHVAECDACRKELDELQATMALLDGWKAPEPSPYFFTRFNARLEEARAAQPAGWLARLRAGLMYGPQPHMRPLAAMALTAVLLVGGGTYLGVSNWMQPSHPPNEAAVVHDLQTLDNNAQLLDTLETLSSADDNGD
jgi:anti-sigma factor RsiW